MPNEMNGTVIRKTITTFIIGMLVAILVAFFLSRLFQPIEAQTEYLLLGVGVVLIVILIFQTIRSGRRMPEQAGEITSGDKLLEGIMTSAAILLLLFTSLLSGPYLLLVPVAAIALTVIYILLKRRRE